MIIYSYLWRFQRHGRTQLVYGGWDCYTPTACIHQKSRTAWQTIEKNIFGMWSINLHLQRLTKSSRISRMMLVSIPSHLFCKVCVKLEVISLFIPLCVGCLSLLKSWLDLNIFTTQPRLCDPGASLHWATGKSWAMKVLMKFVKNIKSFYHLKHMVLYLNWILLATIGCLAII